MRHNDLLTWSHKPHLLNTRIMAEMKIRNCPLFCDAAEILSTARERGPNQPHKIPFCKTELWQLQQENLVQDMRICFVTY